MIHCHSLPLSSRSRWIIGRKGARPFNSGGTQAFQLETEDIGPSKVTVSILEGRFWVLVQSQSSDRFLMTIVIMETLLDVASRYRPLGYQRRRVIEDYCKSAGNQQLILSFIAQCILAPQVRVRAPSCWKLWLVFR